MPATPVWASSILTASFSPASVPLRNPTSQPDSQLFQRVSLRRGFAKDVYRSSPEGSNLVVNLGYPAIDRRGQVQAVIFAELDPNWCGRVSDLNTRIPSAGFIAEIDTSGTILARYPPPKPGRPQQHLPAALLKAALEHTGGAMAAPDSKGVPRWYTFAPRHSQLLGAEVVTILGIPEDALFASANRQLIRNLARARNCCRPRARPRLGGQRCPRRAACARAGARERAACGRRTRHSHRLASWARRAGATGALLRSDGRGIARARTAAAARGREVADPRHRHAATASLSRPPSASATSSAPFSFITGRPSNSGDASRPTLTRAKAFAAPTCSFTPMEPRCPTANRLWPRCCALASKLITASCWSGAPMAHACRSWPASSRSAAGMAP